ncbi:MAG: IS200/IS605 family transposase [Kiritimatiellia bacterium]
MPSTYLSLHIHLVFSTKNREHWFEKSFRTDLHAYLGGTIKGLGAQVRQVGGVSDHVHLLFDPRSTHCLSDLVRELKKNSSLWIREQLKRSAFSWQEGYGAFTVSPSQLRKVKGYIENQEAHHFQQTYREELEGMLMKAGVKYDPAYLD